MRIQHENWLRSIGKLSSYARKNRTKKALWELDSLYRSRYLLNYADSLRLRRNLQRALNRGESYHKLVRAVAYANAGKLRVRTDQGAATLERVLAVAGQLRHLLQRLHPIPASGLCGAQGGLQPGRQNQADQPGELEAREFLRGIHLPRRRRHRRSRSAGPSLGRIGMEKRRCRTGRVKVAGFGGAAARRGEYRPEDGHD